MEYVSSRETRPSHEVSERGEEANHPRNLPYDALRAMASGTGKVERGDGRSQLRKEAIGKSQLRKEAIGKSRFHKEAIGKSRFHKEAINKGKEKLDTIQREAINKGKEKLDTIQREVRQFHMEDKGQLQASTEGSRSEHDDLITEHFQNANASMDKAAWLRNTDPIQNSNQTQKRLKDAGNALKLANEANEREHQRLAQRRSEQQRLVQRRSEQQRLVQQQLPDSRRQEQKKQYRYLVLD
jgi:hypothetical protein